MQRRPAAGTGRAGCGGPHSGALGEIFTVTRAASQRIRKRIEEVFGWVKDQGGQDKTKFRGRARVEASFTLALAAYDLIRLPRLLAEVPP